MNLVLFATAWGPKFGGINAFNREFAVGLADVLGRRGKVFCACVEPSVGDVQDALRNNVTLIGVESRKATVGFDPDWVKSVNTWLRQEGISAIDCWVGHDVVTGDAARFAAHTYGGLLALIHHMSYIDYQTFKGKLGKEVDFLSKSQEDLFEPNDSFIFSVGPLLRDTVNQLSKRQCVELIPGFPELTVSKARRERLDAITFGRMDRASDAIKQGRLAVAAFGLAIKRSSLGITSSVMKFPRLHLIGIEDQVLRNEQEEVERLADHYAGRRVNVLPLPFDTDRRALFGKLSEANVAMMLSLHDGFGLTGWEAIAAEVPLVVGENTGLFRLIDERLKGSGTGCIHSIDIEGLRGAKENFSPNDLDRVCERLLRVAGDLNGHRRNSALLKAQLIEKLGCTWRHTAMQFLEQIGVAVDEEVISHKMPSGENIVENLATTNQRERLSWMSGPLSGEMIRVRSTSNDLDHSKLILTANRVRIIMNDGKRFFQKYRDAFMQRKEGALASSSELLTEICILAPDGPHLEIVARRSEKTAQEQSADIDGSATLIKEIFKGTGQLDLYGMKDFFPYCLFQYDDTLLISLYPAFERIEELPMLILSPTGESSDVYYSLRKNADLLFHRAKVGQAKWFVRL